MRKIGFSLWVVINFTFLGMAGYIYVVLSSFWRQEVQVGRIKSITSKLNKFNKENQIAFYTPHFTPHLKISSNSSSYSTIVKNSDQNEKPKADNRLERRSSENCSNNNNNNSNNNNQSKCIDSTKNELEIFKNKLFLQLRRVLHGESNVFKTDNPYFVNYLGPRERYQLLTPNEIKCRLKKAGLRLLTKSELPRNILKFSNVSDEKFLNENHYNSCAIVSSAGSLLYSKLGHLIDEHDIVVRFNHAPTENFEEDVGVKTTVRLVNSQVVAKEEFNFISNPLFKSVTLVVWDPSNYTATLQEWYEKPDFNFFEFWAKQKRLYSKKNSFILDPRSIWKIWNFIQSLTPLRIRKNPPSSGFLGLALLMPYCDYIDFFEYVPSLRLTKRCHYFEDVEDESCTFGVWHPLSAEKMLSMAMNEVNDTTVFKTGFIRVKGYKHLKC